MRLRLLWLWLLLLLRVLRSRVAGLGRILRRSAIGLGGWWGGRVLCKLAGSRLGGGRVWLRVLRLRRRLRCGRILLLRMRRLSAVLRLLRRSGRCVLWLCWLLRIRLLVAVLAHG